MNGWKDGWTDRCKSKKDVKRSERHRLAKLQHRLSVTSPQFLLRKIYPETQFTDNDGLRIFERFTSSLVCSETSTYIYLTRVTVTLKNSLFIFTS